ncbi:filamin-A-interacting protein 1 [Dunckerocampus dactyliophorus]|uniref:filamin-A-interacting protein 1 n=1 Tax=Dunckerocampus dactyliophorus TaxID=161453 RepID=UPI0024061660|nr:filamin-A-interacting protein 1 [Dunckerocampus dactyliophorus]
MRARKCTMETQDDGEGKPKSKGFKKQEENAAEPSKRKVKVQREEKEKKMAKLNLSKNDLLQLLGIMEGEVQAREDIISLLRSEKSRMEKLESHYGSALPAEALKALQRDGMVTQDDGCTDDVYEKPIAKLERLEHKQKETYRRMLEQLLLAEKCHRRTVLELDSEKRKHADFMNKSDDFTNLLEQERERLKKLLEQEKTYQAHKDKEHNRRLEKIRAELVQLKSFALMLVDERQLHMEQLDLQSQKVQELAQKSQEKEQRLAAVTDAAKEDSQKVLKLEAELEHKVATSKLEHEEMTTKLSNQESQSRQLRLKLAGLASKIEELEDSNKLLQKSEEELQELREKISNGECGSSSLMAELETLRKKVLEMEGKDEEITKMETQCKELRTRLQDEVNVSKELRLEVDKLHKRMVDLEKLEGAFSRSKTECSALHTNLEKEKRVVTDLAGELERIKTRLKELESLEAKFERAEMILKDDLMKLKSFTVILADERKNMADKLKREEQKSEDLSRMFKAEECKVTAVTEKLIEESKKLLKVKSDMELKVTTVTEEKDKIKGKLTSEEESCRQLNRKLCGMKAAMDKLEETERMRTNKQADDNNRIKELTLEIESLRSRLKQLEVVQGDLMKTEDEYDLLEKKFRTEQDKANSLSKLVEEMKSQLARSKAVEKGEVMGPEAQLRMRCKMEEAKSRDLEVDIQALKEKIHELMTKEDQLSQLQVDYSVLQQRFVEEQESRKSISQEVANLSQELEATRRYSRALRPGMNGRRMMDAALTSTAVQTDVLANESADDDTAAGFIRKSVLEEKHLMSNLRQRGLKQPSVLERYPPASAESEARRSWMPWMKKGEAISVKHTTPERTPLLSPEVSTSQKSGQPLHIRVTPDSTNSTATLEITSPRAEDFFSSTTIIPTLGLQKPRITIVPKATGVTGKTKACDMSDRAMSPVTITTISTAKSPSKSGSKDPQPAVSIITVSTSPVTEAHASPEGHRTSTSRTVIQDSGAASLRNYNNNIVTTEDNKIHIHLRPSDQREIPMGTVLRSPRQPSGGSKMTSSLTITPATSAPCRPTQSVPSWEVQSATPLPVSRALTVSSKTLDASTATKLESREGQLLKIELRKSSAPIGES